MESEESEDQSSDSELIPLNEKDKTEANDE
jgi:ATP-dependent RNA helicase DDX18/HAS1